VKWLGHEDDCSPPSSAKIKNAWSTMLWWHMGEWRYRST